MVMLYPILFAALLYVWLRMEEKAIIEYKIDPTAPWNVQSQLSESVIGWYRSEYDQAAQHPISAHAD